MTEEEFQKLEDFNREFKALVRKYMPEYPRTADQARFLGAMQDRTSVFSPFIWDGE